MVNILTILLFSILGISILTTIAAVWISLASMVYIDPWWTYSEGECQTIYNSINFFSISAVICTIIGIVAYYFGKPNFTGIKALISKITLGVMLFIIFLSTTILHASTTPRGIMNAFKNFTDGKKDNWTLAQKDEYKVWEDTKTIGMTTDQKNAWLDQWDLDFENFFYTFNQKLTVIYFFQLLEILFIILYYSHFIIFGVKNPDDK